jgi:hypothetical protein
MASRHAQLAAVKPLHANHFGCLRPLFSLWAKLVAIGAFRYRGGVSRFQWAGMPTLARIIDKTA